MFCAGLLRRSAAAWPGLRGHQQGVLCAPCGCRLCQNAPCGSQGGGGAGNPSARRAGGGWRGY